MAGKTSPIENTIKSKALRAKSAKTKKTLKPRSNKPAPKTDADKIRALEEQLAQHDVEISRLSDENQLLLKETEEGNAELAVINSVQQALASKLDLQGIYDAVGDKIREIFDIASALIFSIDRQAQVFRVPYPKMDAEYPLTEFVEHFDKTKQPLLINQNAHIEAPKYGIYNLSDPYDLSKISGSLLFVPLLVGTEVTGLISLQDGAHENVFTDSDVRLLQTLANSMSVALENARLFDETQRLLKETERRATELQVINNIGQTLTDGLDLNNTIERVGERLRETLKFENFGIAAYDAQTELATSLFLIRNGKRVDPKHFLSDKYRLAMRLASRREGKPWVVNTNAEKYWIKFGTVLDDEIAKSFVMFPLLAGRDLVGSITIADYERENAFVDFPISLIETIASNIGTVVQNVRLFEETQRLLKETEQRATELQIINNIGQTLTEGLDLQSTLERVGERLREALDVKSLGIFAFDPKEGLAISNYFYHYGRQFTPQRFSMSNYKLSMRLASRVGNKPWIVNTNAERYWKKFLTDILPEWTEIPKAFVVVPLLAGGELVGNITIGDYENENAFVNLPLNLLETIASNMGTAIQNVRLFDETQRLLKETEQRATELQIINNIGQTLSEGLDLSTTLERVGDRLREALKIESIGIIANDIRTGLVISAFVYLKGKRVIPDRYSLSKNMLFMRFVERTGGKPVVINTNVEKNWRKFLADSPEWAEIPKAFVMVPLLAGGELVGSITIPDYEREDVFTDLPINMLETIASNMGTAIQNVRLFEETKKLFTEAEESRAAAEQANKSKSTFLANMSHELRTPLNAIIGFTRIVKKKAEGALPEKQIENLDKVLISSEHLLGLINTVLDIAKIEAGRMDVVPSKFSLSTLTDQCATLATPLLKPNVTLEKQADETLGLIFSDQDKIKQIVLNLLSNAAKFTHAGKIILSVQKVNDENVNISVTDSGIGISEEALGRVFEEFQQADTSTTREYGGTGLGLAISRNLARLLGGDLTATSELGKGSTFTLTIPIKYGRKSASSPDAKLDSTQSAESQADDGSTKQNRSEEAVKTILIVEDTELNINLLTQLLEDDYNLLIANDGEQGVSMAQQENPDLILIDISLPVMDGYEATRRIRAAKISIPIIGLSAHAMSGDEEKAKEAGCDDYMTKPVDEILLIKKLNQYLR